MNIDPRSRRADARRWRRRGLGRLVSPMPLAGLALAAATILGASSGARADANCPTSNPPNEIVLAAGSGQTAQLGKQFQTAMQVRLANTNSCPLTGNLAGVHVAFVAPGNGASGVFASSGTRTAVVGTDAQGVATAPTFTANYTAGSYTVAAQSDHGTVGLDMANTASGLAAAIAVSAGNRQEAAASTEYAQPLQARVTDANGAPVQGATVSFSIFTGATGAGASFLGGGQATATTDSNGLATSPPLLANATPGKFMAAASVDGVAAVATYKLTNLAGKPNAIKAGAASGESTMVGTRFPIPLAVTVTDKHGNPVKGATVVFAAPAHGASARFLVTSAKGAGANRRRAERASLHRTRTVRVRTNADGIAVAPTIAANKIPGGYVVTAAVKGSSKAAAFALVNEPGTGNG